LAAGRVLVVRQPIAVVVHPIAALRVSEGALVHPGVEELVLVVAVRPAAQRQRAIAVVVLVDRHALASPQGAGVELGAQVIVVAPVVVEHPLAARLRITLVVGARVLVVAVLQ
jgi:hypothetical protein